MIATEMFSQSQAGKDLFAYLLAHFPEKHFGHTVVDKATWTFWHYAVVVSVCVFPMPINEWALSRLLGLYLCTVHDFQSNFQLMLSFFFFVVLSAQS
jgi:hypothetical protein